MSEATSQPVSFRGGSSTRGISGQKLRDLMDRANAMARLTYRHVRGNYQFDSTVETWDLFAQQVKRVLQEPTQQPGFQLETSSYSGIFSAHYWNSLPKLPLRSQYGFIVNRQEPGQHPVFASSEIVLPQPFVVHIREKWDSGQLESKTSGAPITRDLAFLGWDLFPVLQLPLKYFSPQGRVSPFFTSEDEKSAQMILHEGDIPPELGFFDHVWTATAFPPSDDGGIFSPQVCVCVPGETEATVERADINLTAHPHFKREGNQHECLGLLWRLELLFHPIRRIDQIEPPVEHKVLQFTR